MVENIKFPTIYRKTLMNSHEKIRQQIRHILEEAINNFIKLQPETKTKQLKDNSKPLELGDPLTDVQMNQKANELGSDGRNAPAVSVQAGSTKGGSTSNTGQKTAKFTDKTRLAK